MKGSDNLVVVPVNSGCTEFSSVIDRFQAQVGKKEIVKVRVAEWLFKYFYFINKKSYKSCMLLCKDYPACLFPSFHLGVQLHILILLR